MAVNPFHKKLKRKKLLPATVHRAEMPNLSHHATRSQKYKLLGRQHVSGKNLSKKVEKTVKQNWKSIAKASKALVSEETWFFKRL